MTSDAADTYTWDTRRHLTSVTGYDTGYFRYDALGRRLFKNLDGTLTAYVGACPEGSRRNGLNPVQEQNGNSVVIANMPTGLNTGEYFTRTESACGGPLSYLTDALGSTDFLVDSHGRGWGKGSPATL